jgi:hypothetical protein
MAKRDDPFSKRSHNQRIAADVDQSEFQALLIGEAMLDAGIVDDRIAGAMDDFSVDGGMPDWQSIDLQNDNATSAVATEISHRVEVLGGLYPFEIVGSRLRYRRRQTNTYEFCLAISQAPSLTTGDFVKLPRLFERVTARLVADYLGSFSDFHHTGAPRDGDPAQSFKAAIEDLHLRSGEWEWDPEGELPPLGPITGDEGADFFVWKKAPDGRPIGQLFLIGQCACGNDWTSKWYDLDFMRLKKWARSSMLTSPVKVFATPFVASEGNLREASRAAGLVFDRLRLTKVAQGERLHLTDVPWHNEMQDVIDLVRSKVNSVNAAVD